MVGDCAVVRVRVLGATEIAGGGALPTRDSKVLAALALAFPDPVPPTGLAEAVWDESPPASWNKAIQGAISRLRRACGPDAIESGAGGYRLVVDVDDIDVYRFESLVAQATAVVATDPSAAGRLLDDAGALWRGEPFADLNRAPSALGAVGRIEARRRSAEELRVEVLLGEGRPEEAAALALQLCASEPYDERRTVLLVSALYRSGRPVEALAALRGTAQRLRDDLGLDPGPDLAELEFALLRHDAALRPTAPPSPLDSGVAVGARDAATFVGRSEEVAAVQAALRPGAIVTVAGPGGAGKTRLVRHVLDSGAWRGDVAFVELADLQPGQGAVGRCGGTHTRRGRAGHDRGREHQVGSSRAAPAARPRQL